LSSAIMRQASCSGTGEKCPAQDNMVAKITGMPDDNVPVRHVRGVPSIFCSTSVRLLPCRQSFGSCLSPQCPINCQVNRFFDCSRNQQIRQLPAIMRGNGPRIK